MFFFWVDFCPHTHMNTTKLHKRERERERVVILPDLGRLLLPVTVGKRFLYTILKNVVFFFNQAPLYIEYSQSVKDFHHFRERSILTLSATTLVVGYRTIYRSPSSPSTMGLAPLGRPQRWPCRSPWPLGATATDQPQTDGLQPKSEFSCGVPFYKSSSDAGGKRTGRRGRFRGTQAYHKNDW